MNSRTETATIAVALSALTGLILFQFWNTWAADLSAIYLAARSYGLGQEGLIYLAPPGFFGGSASPEWERMVAALGFEGEVAFPYVYPPIWAALLSRFALSVGPLAFFNTVLVIHTAALIGSILLAWRIADRPRASLATWVALSLLIIVLSRPFFAAFWLNQPQILVTFVVLLGFERYRQGHSVSAGMALGLAAALKLNPVIFGVIFLMDRNWKAAGAMAVTGLALLAISILTTGIELHRDFLEQLSRVSENALLAPLNYGLDGLLHLIQHGAGSASSATDGVRTVYIISASPVIRAIGLFGLLVGLAAVWVKAGRRSGSYTLLWKLLAVWTISIFFGPLAWSHYLIGPLLLLPGLLLTRPTRWGTLCIIVALVLLSHPVQLLFVRSETFYLWLMAVGAISLCFLILAALLRPTR